MDGSPGKTNMLLAAGAGAYHYWLGLPVFAQAEVAQVLTKEHVPLVGETAHQLSFDVRRPDYLDTYQVAKAQEVLCKRRGYKKILLISFVPHLWRAMWVYEKLGFTVVIPADSPRMIHERESRAIQWRTPLRVYLYELGARLYYLYKGYI